MQMPEKISFMFEAAERCNQKCSFCYNAWRPGGAPRKSELPTPAALRVLGRVFDEAPCHSIALSGGEPLLRDDILDLVSFIKKKRVKACLVTNGVFLSPEAIGRLVSCGLDAFQISLLGDEAEIHNRLTGSGGFEKTLGAILDIKKAGGRVQVFFVALAENIERFRGVLEMCVLLGVDGVSLGRFLPGGSGLAGWEKLLPSPDLIEGALEMGEAFAWKYRLEVAVANPLPPCLHEPSQYPRVKFGSCAAGRSDHALFAIDPEGNLKVCSHSPVVLGNLLTQSFREILRHPFLDEFVGAVPEFCRDCAQLETCRGGCRSSAQVCHGSPSAEDPYLTVWKSRARKPAGPLAAPTRASCEEVL